ncbi:MAG TPA: STAS/SEC14 domain-containing protein [Burkholderiales bacterium]|nr:STAS/SEC14 domain-containing protein [Burkholderiales bacterium]
MITIQHEGKLTVVGMYGRLELADFRRFEEEVAGQIKASGQIDLLVDLRGMVGYTLDVALEELKFTREHAQDVGKIAILSESERVAWTALLARFFVKARIRVFDSERGAHEWLEEQD